MNQYSLSNQTHEVRANAQRFYWFMNERETIRQKRLNGERWPWTEDLVLRKYSFTNVMREYDRVSIWIGLHLTARYAHSPHLWQILAVARQINWPPSLEQISAQLDIIARKGLDEHRLVSMREELDAYQKAGNKVYTGAYMIHADSDMRTASWWLSKNHYVIGMVIGQLIGHTPPRTSLQDFTLWMMQFESWGGFMSYEVACDLRWAEGWLDEAPDIYTWANPGPGAKRGLNRIFDRPLKSSAADQHFVREMKLLLDSAIFYEWSVEFPRPLEMRDIEHSLCEFDKWLRATNGEGKPRSQYKPTLELVDDQKPDRPQRQSRSASRSNVVPIRGKRP